MNIKSKIKNKTKNNMKLISKKIALIALVVMAFAACKSEEPSMPAENNCEVQGHFVKVPGAQGYYGEYMISVGNGNEIQPVFVDNNTINIDEITCGMAVKLSYKLLTKKETSSLEMKKTVTDVACENFEMARVTCISKSKHPWESFGYCGDR